MYRSWSQGVRVVGKIVLDNIRHNIVISCVSFCLFGAMELKANRSDIDKTQYQLWYEELKPWAIRSEFVHLPPEFVDYLKQDGIFLPSHLNYVQENTSSDDESDGDQVGSSLNRSHVDTPSFPDFDQLLLTAMNNLGGDVAIKTNWSSPLDVTWMTLGSLKASSLRDIYLQLKSSDRIMFDLEHMYDQCDDEGPKYLSHPVLVLRKWANLLPSMEFRVFVRDWKLVGISQRDCCTFYPFMSSKINEIEEIIRAFFLSNIADKELPRDCKFL